MEEEDREWKSRMERKVDELTDVGRFVMMNMGSVLKAVEGLKKEVTEWSEVVKKAEIGFRKEVEDRDADGEEDDEDEEEEKKDGSDRWSIGPLALSSSHITCISGDLSHDLSVDTCT